MRAKAILDNLQHKQTVKDNKSGQYRGPIKYYDEDIAQYYNPDLVINDMLNENRRKNFTSILLIGTPGTGKTTLATFLAHHIHTKGGYAVRWYGKEEIANLDKVLHDLPSQDTILIFDDVSMAIKRIKDPQKRLDVLEALTTARHPAIGADRNIITIANIHYMFALEKLWRDQGSWKIFTDLQGEELQNFNNYSRFRYDHQASSFSTIALNQFRKGYFELKTTNKSEYKKYYTDHPFRFAMVHDGVKLRFMLFPKEGCSTCQEKHTNKKYKIEPDALIDVMFSRYKKFGTQALRYLAINKGQRQQMNKNFLYAMDDAMKMDGKYHIEWPKVAEALREKAGMGVEKRDYRKKNDQDNIIKEIISKSGETK